MNKGEEKQEKGENDVERKGSALNVNHYDNSWTSDIWREFVNCCRLEEASPESLGAKQKNHRDASTAG